MENRVVSSVGLVHLGPAGTVKEFKRSILRPIIWLAHKDWVPLWAKEFMVSRGLSLLNMKTFLAGGSFGDTFENDLMKLIFQAVAIANIADNAASSPLTSLYWGLHTADPGEAGNQTSSETGYTGYARVAVLRAAGAGGFTVTGGSISPTGNVDFPACSAGTATITHCSVGTASSGAGKLIGSGTVSPNIAVSAGVTPRLTTATAITLD